MAPQTLPLRECRTFAQAGGKGAILGELVRIGQPVPDGFVITTAALAGLTGPLPPELITQIGQQYELLGASATAEDLPGATTLVELGRRLVAEGILDRVDDVWHCRWDELVTVPRGDLRRRVTDRRARRQHLEGVPLISIANRVGRVEGGDALVAGTPASRGQASGPVRVISHPEDFGRLRSGDVLVCPYTNPAWTPLFQRAAAVVVDSGGSGSHAAIVAREYQIPAVMGTGTGTVVLTDGVRVRVDGDRGLVLAEES